MNLLALLRYLAALDKHRHFGRAARACHITPPVLSNAMRALEAEFGTAIFRRGRAFGGFIAEGERVLAVFVPFAYDEAAANLMTNAALDPVGKIPEFKYCAVAVRRGGQAASVAGYGTAALTSR